MKTQTFFKRYKFFLILLALNFLLLFAAPDLGRLSLAASFTNLKQMLSILPPIFILMGLMDVWIPKETMMKYLGKEAGILGGFIAFLLGSFSAGPLYASFPMAAMFRKKGASLINIYIFIGAWSATKLPMMMFEITQLGAAFSLLRFTLNFIAIILIAFVLEKTAQEEE